MLFTRAQAKAGKRGVVQLPLAQLHQLRCKACPLDKARLHHPKMEATGAKKPEVYVLGEAPGEQEDAKGEQFVGVSGRMLRRELSKRERRVRFNNCLRCRPPKNRDPTAAEMECCRQWIVEDIERAKPKLILGAGNVPLRWLIGQVKAGIVMWRGRALPVRVGLHDCWYYPILHPSFINRKKHDVRAEIPGDEWKRVFQRDVARALREVDELPEPKVEDPGEVFTGIKCLTGESSWHFRRLMSFLRKLSTLKSFAIDLETSRARPYAKGAKLLSVAVGTKRQVVAFALDHSSAKWSPKQRKLILQALEKALCSRAKKVAQNLGFELEWLVEVYGPHIAFTGWHDTMVQAYCLDERTGVHNLDALCLIHFGIRLKQQSSVSRDRLEHEALDDLLPYNGADAKYTHRLYHAQHRLLREQGLLDIYRDHVQRVPTFVLAQHAGLHVDQKRVVKLKLKYRKAIEKKKAAIAELPEVAKYREKHGELSPTSPQQLVVLFRDVLRRPEGRKGRGDGYTTEAAALEKMKGCAVAKKVLELRKLTKVLGTYLDPLDARSQKTVLYPDGKLHTTFNSTFTTTGRSSSERPNLQNFPKRDPVRKRIRRVVVPRPGELLLSGDFKQLEVVVIGIMSGSPALMLAIREDHDIHREWAERLAKLDKGAIDRFGGTIQSLRTEIKNRLVFPAFYGAWEDGIARYLKTTPRVTKQLFGDFWKEFAEVKEWQEEELRLYRERGYVECLTGRRRRAPLNNNMVLNTPVQGTASDIVVDAMNRLSKQSVEEDKLWMRPLINIHDDLTFSVPVADFASCLDVVVRGMLSCKYDWLTLPLTVEMAKGKDWYSMEKVGSFRSDRL